MNYEKRQPSREVRARRTEKQWRHEERELASTHAFWGVLVGLHGVVAGLAGVLVGQGAFPVTAFVLIGVLSLFSMTALAALNFLSRTADKGRALYFSITSQKDWPQEFDSKREDRSSKAAVDRYLFWQKPVELVVMAFFLMSAMIFGSAVVTGG